ncbi:hypothetical protein ADK86_03310 [Streptomyces sp. NRRL F-5755]|nr:hypothetical protein ADK86_03310 [Streptomyces sp. NRRL F-5755]
MLKRDLSIGTVSFDPPDGTFAPSLPCTNLFLYDVRENQSLRVNDWKVERGAGTAAITRRPPARIDCSYLVTAWAGDTQNEHLLLGRVIRILLRYPTLPEELLQGGLVGQELPLPTTALQPSLLQSTGEFWQALGGRPKAAVGYAVTLAVPVAEPASVPLVTERITTVAVAQA